jgi:hypothetical protein
VNMDGPIRPDHLHHDPPLHPAPRFPDQADRSTPRFWTVSPQDSERRGGRESVPRSKRDDATAL